MKSDSDLVKELNQGSALAFDELFHKYFDKVYHFAFSILKTTEDAEEIVQGAFLTIWEKRKSIDSQMSVKSLLFTIAYNLTMDYFRAKNKERKYREYMLIHASLNYDPEQLFLSEESNSQLKIIVEELPPKQREIFTLRQDKNLSYREISQKLMLSTKTVEKNISLAIKYIRRRMGDNLKIAIIIISLFS